MKLKIPASFNRAAITANSYNEADNTIEVVFASEFQVERRTWDGTKFIEILECTDKAVRLQRINAGANLVDSHNTYQVKSIVGVVVRAWVENKQCKALIRLSKREDVQGTVQDIVDGIITNISVGYQIHGATQVENDNEDITITVTDWEPMELSVLSVPADYTVGVRSADKEPNYYELNITKLNRGMTPEEIAAAAAAEAERQRGANPPAPAAPVAAPVAAPANQPDHTALERTRGVEIRKLIRAANINNHEFEDGLISRGVDVEGAKAAIFDHLHESQNPTRSHQPATGLRVTADEVTKRRAAMSIAIEHRVNPAITLTDQAREYRGLSMLEMGREALELAGVNTRGMSRVEVAQMSLNCGSRAVGMHSTSDFPIVLGNTINRTLRAEYDLQERTFTPWASRGVAKDFRTMTRTSLGEVGSFKEVKEGGEYEYTTLGEAGESYKVIKYGEIIAYTWEMMINDDLGAFSRIPRKIAAAAARKQSDLMYGIFSTNANMSDGNALFSSAHANLAGTPAAIGIDSFGKLRAQMRVQKGVNKQDFLNITPKFLLAGPTNEQLALQYTSPGFVANVAGNQNVWSGTLTVIVEPRITGNEWYFAASPNTIDTVEYSFLEGEPELFTTQREGFEVDGIEIKARMVFGCKAIDWRGLAKNAGV